MKDGDKLIKAIKEKNLMDAAEYRDKMRRLFLWRLYYGKSLPLS